ncbi:DUF6311 domain-containing protein [Flavobacterium psychrotrophum]|uniref:DUF6311 domain-containing protein n=1 Tax=Flavobacterium psychrotrophum TaxID=2294119 RepID=UPI000E31EBEF|nr:DUF6311 domain-containing protein [Flavobacterium psychrotrophum]
MKRILAGHYLIAYLIAIIIFYFSYGLGILNPQNINWLLSARHDWGTHYLGWAFYRDSAWTFPLGQMEGYVYPVGANVGFTDSIPLVAIPLKLISGILPNDFQFLGFWLLSCYIMAAHFTLKIFDLYKIPTYVSLLAVVLIVGNPVLFYRGMHPALCAHGFILGSIYYYLVAANAENVKRINRKQFWLSFLSGLINPYLCLLVVGFSFILPIKNYFYDKLLTAKQTILIPVITCAAIVLSWIIVGMVSLHHGERLDVADGYGLYGFNYNSFHNSSGFSAFLPGMQWVSPHQYEGFMYLGVGFMVLIALALVYFIIKGQPVQFFKNHKWLLPLIILTVLLSLFATTNRVTYGESVLFEVPIPKIIKKFGNIFRASGRFFWLTYYLIILFFTVVFLKSKIPAWAKAIVLALIVALQAYDIKHLYTKNLPSGTYDSPLDEAKWNAILPHFEKMITYPPFNNHVLNNMDYQDLALLALKNHKQISLGYTARENGRAYRKFSQALNLRIASGSLSSDELYITTPQYLEFFKNSLQQKKLHSKYLDGYYLLYTNNEVPVVNTDAAVQRHIDSITQIVDKKFVTSFKTPAFDNNRIDYNVEEAAVNKNTIYMRGWAFLTEQDNNKNDSVFIAISDKGKTDIAYTRQFKRPDLTPTYNKQYLEDSGFMLALYNGKAFNGNEHVSIAIKSGGTWTLNDLGPISKLKSGKKPSDKHKK